MNASAPASPYSVAPPGNHLRLCDRTTSPVHVSTAIKAGLATLATAQTAKPRRATQ